MRTSEEGMINTEILEESEHSEDLVREEVNIKIDLKKFPAFYRTESCIIVFTTARHWCLS
jgi:hypothetical protein